MSRASFWSAVGLGCCVALLASLALWHHGRIETLEEQVAGLRLQSKFWWSHEQVAAPVPTPAPAPIEPEELAAATSRSSVATG